MEIRRLDVGTWSGFSDRELQGLKTNTSSSPSSGPGSEQESVRGVQHSLSEAKKLPQKNEEAPKDELVNLPEPGELFEQQLRRRQEMEEANKKKKKVLEDALVKRYQQSQAESSKLAGVKSELERLDQLVTKDVAFLRDKIETASKDYTLAKLRFEQAETEYVSAKLALATCQEKKDLLSQHLCTVIQENEQRKAGKLSSLMTQLDIHQQS